MMPNMRDAIRGFGRRVTGQVIKQKIEDHEAVQAGVDKLRATLVMVPLPAQKIAIKPEGQRKWKWWQATSATMLEVGWYVKPDRDGKRLFEVMEHEDFSQARVHNYQLAEAPR